MGCHSSIRDNMLEVLYMAHSEAWIGGEVSQRQHGSDGGSTVAWISQWVGVKESESLRFLFYFYWVWWWVVTRERGVWDWESLREFREWVWESFFFFHNQIWSDSYSFQIHSNSSIFFSWNEYATIWFFFFLGAGPWPLKRKSIT